MGWTETDPYAAPSGGAEGYAERPATLTETEIRPTFMRDSDGRTWTRRPIGHRAEPDGPEPVTTVATFLYREDARAAELAIAGYVTRIQYVGAWMRWTVVARRKSWSSGREVYLQRDGTLGRYA